MALFNAHGMKPWWDWAKPLRRRDAKALAAARSEHASEIDFWRFVQWCWDEQCRALKAYANGKGIALIGDIPIYVADNSADVWSRPDLYELGDDGLPTVIAGVPPDDLGPDGQRWGNPIYRWDRMAAEDYRLVDAARAGACSAQADMVRIDHFRGFAGYWEIPASSPTAKVGRWVAGPGLRAVRGDRARNSAQLPIIAEDLGMITPDVVELIEGCGFPRMKVLMLRLRRRRHARVPAAELRAQHHRLHQHARHRHRARLVGQRASTASATSPALPGLRRRGLSLGRDPRLHATRCRKLAVFPLQDVLGLPTEHRMNLPGTLGPANWSWRFEWPMLAGEHARVLALMAQPAAGSLRSAESAPDASPSSLPALPRACPG